MPTEPPRLQMFKATVLVESPVALIDFEGKGVRQALYGATVPHNGNSRRASSKNNIDMACNVVDDVIDALAGRFVDQYPYLRTILASNVSTDIKFEHMFHNFDILSKIREEFVPMIASNKGD
jgi:hypothetical protein